MAGICSQTCAGAADCSSLTWKGRQAREEAFYNSGSAQRRLVEEWPAALGFGSLITNFPLTDAQFSCRKVRTLPPEEQPSALAAGSYKKYHTPLPPCVLSRLGRQSGFFPRKAAFALWDILRCKAAERGSLCRDAREQNSPPFGMPEGGAADLSELLDRVIHRQGKDHYGQGPHGVIGDGAAEQSDGQRHDGQAAGA